jgi:hypothetical protein
MYKEYIHLTIFMLSFKNYKFIIINEVIYFLFCIIKVKVDAKTKALLDEYKKKKRHELAKKAANDTTAFKFIYEEDDADKKGSNSTDADGKVK